MITAMSITPVYGWAMFMIAFSSDATRVMICQSSAVAPQQQMCVRNAARYAWVKKDMRQFDVAQGAEGIVVYSTGYLYGEWPDGTPFDGNRYVDRFVVTDGKIVKMDVWNDSAERILTRKGIIA